MADVFTGVVRILTPDGKATLGAGFLADRQGLVITCAHVVGERDEVLVEFPLFREKDLPRYRAWVEKRDPAVDLAGLRLIGALPAELQPLPLGSSSHVAAGDTFRTFGFPNKVPEGMVGKCEVVGQTRYNGHPILQLRSPEITRGFSGAPVWDEELGVVVGMVLRITWPDEYGRLRETTYAIPVETLRETFPELRLPEGCPYRGLAAFEAQHTDWYFGREAATAELLDALTRYDTVLLVGVSGSGKSSLVRAGLEKGLRNHPIPGLAERARCLTVPGHHPIFNLVLTLADLPGIGPQRVAQALGLSSKALTKEGDSRRKAAEQLEGMAPDALANALTPLIPPEGLLLIVDQFERLYTECSEEEVQRHFIDTLLRMAEGGKVKVLLALRADFYGMALAHPGLERVVKAGGQVTLGHMSEEELRAAIEEPARRMKRSLQPGLVERLIADVQGRAGDLPLLEFALTALWERDNQKGVLTLATYESLGYETPKGERFPGVQGAIVQRAEAAWRALDREEQKAARRVFLSLVAPGPMDKQREQEAKDTSRRAWQLEWDKITRQVAQKLANARLLVTGQDPVSGQPTVEVAHEALIRAWPRLQRWLRDFRDFLRWYQEKLAPFLQRWLSENQHRDFLLPEAVVNEARSWLEQYPDLLSGPPERYIQESIAWQENLRKLSEARRIAVQAQAVFDNSALGLIHGALLAVESARRLPLKLAVNLLWYMLHLLPPLPVYVQHEGPVWIVTSDPLGKWGASGGEDGKVLLWDRNGKIIAQIEHQARVWKLAFSPDGHWLVTSSRDGMTILWDAYALFRGEDPASCEIVRLPHQGTVWTIAFDRNGELVATASQDGLVRIWAIPSLLDARQPHKAEILYVSHNGPAALGEFSPDGLYLITGGDDGTVRVWDIGSGKEKFRFQHDGPIYAGDISPTGKWIASGSEDGTVRVWDMSTGEEVVRLPHKGEIWTVNFSSDGSLLATGGEEGIVRIWEIPLGREIVQLEHEAAVNVVHFWRNNRFLVSGSSDATARLWEAVTGVEIARMLHEGEVTSIAVNSNDKWLITGSTDGLARIWNLVDVMAESRIGVSVQEWSEEAILDEAVSKQINFLIQEICARLPRNLTLAEWRRYLGDTPYHPICLDLPVPEK